MSFLLLESAQSDLSALGQVRPLPDLKYAPQSFDPTHAALQIMEVYGSPA